MKIRAITFFAALSSADDMGAIANAATFLQDARARFTAAGFDVQTLRLATAPFSALMPAASAAEWVAFARRIEAEANAHGVEYISIGAVPAHTPTANLMALSAIPDIIRSTETVFTSALVATPETGINLNAIQHCAEVVHTIGKQTADGFGNLRFAMLANVPAGSPFFPGSYHHGKKPAFAIATEAADLAVSATQNTNTLEKMQNLLTRAIQSQATKMDAVVDALVDEHNIAFGGYDFSLAPFPDEAISIGAAMEHLGVEAFGGHGTLFATAFFTNIIKAANPHPVGYNGVMLPVLEDPVLAQRAIDSTFTINDLLLYSAVCGTGLDTIPIPGNSTAAQIAATMLDVATLSTVLNKPLSARLMPVPGLAAGETTAFNFEFFANSKILSLKANAAPHIFQHNSFFSFRK